MRKRKAFPFVPRWHGEISGWAVRAIVKNFASLSADYEFEDLMQEAYLVYMRCKDRYGSSVDNAAWFMALFKVSLRNHLWQMAERSGRRRMLSLDSLRDVDGAMIAELFSDGGEMAERLFSGVLFREIFEALPKHLQAGVRVVVEFGGGGKKPSRRAKAQRRRALRLMQDAVNG